MKSVGVPTIPHRIRACSSCAGTKLDPNDPDLPCRACSSISPISSTASEPGCAHRWRRHVIDGALIRACELCSSHGEAYEWRKHWRLNADKSVTCRLRGVRRRDRATSLRPHEESMVMESPESLSEGMRRALDEENAKVNVMLKRTQTGLAYQSLSSPTVAVAG